MDLTILHLINAFTEIPPVDEASGMERSCQAISPVTANKQALIVLWVE